MGDEMQHTIESWFEILNWKKLPNLGSCHTISEYKQFLKNYYFSLSIERFEKNLLSTLTGKFEHLNIRILGRPGCGKTSFIYYLRKAKNNNHNAILKDYVFFVFHVNRVEDHNDEEIIRDHILKAWRKYYYASGKEEVYERYDQQGLSVNQKNNKLADYFIKNKSNFNKVLVFIIEDTDLLSGAEMVVIARHVIKNIEVNSVKKWLVIREVTYNGYSLQERNFLNAFFPDRKVFPEIPIYEIVKHRINNTTMSDKPKNPFSEELCMLVLERLFDGNIREAFPALTNILEHNSPGAFHKNTSEEVIQNYVDKAAISTFMTLNILPNIHEPKFRSVFLPLPIDILMITKYLQMKELIFGAVNMAINNRAKKARLPIDEGYLKIRESDFNFSLDKLVDAELIEKSGKTMSLTKKGHLLSDYVARKHYKEISKRLIRDTYDDATYWRLADVSIVHDLLALDMLEWPDISYP